MLLPIFDLAEEIEKYNQLFNTRYSDREDFDYACFAPERLANVNAIITMLNEGSDPEYFTDEEKQYWAQRKKRVAATRDYLHGKRSQKPGLIAQDPILEVSVVDKYHLVTWLRVQQQQFAKQKNWDMWRESSGQETTLVELQEQWNKQQLFIRHTNASIYQMVFDWLPRLIDYHTQAKQQLGSLWRRLWMPAIIYTSYSDYLDNFLKTARARQYQVAESLFMRLLAWDVGQNNVATYFIGELKSAGAVLTHSYQPLPKIFDPLTSEQFGAFHYYIERYGTPDLKQRLRTLSWFTKQNVVSVIMINAGLLVPAALANAIPNRPRFPRWLSRGTHIRHEFFKDKGQLLAMLQKSPDITTFHVELNALNSVEHMLSNIHRQEYYVDDAINELNDKKYTAISRFFQRETYEFLTNWRAILVRHREVQLENKLLLAEKIVAELLNKHTDTLSAAIIPWQACQILRGLLEEVESDFNKQITVNIEIKQRHAKLQKKTTDIFALNRAYAMMQHLALQGDVQPCELDYLFNYLELLQMKDKELANGFYNVCKPLLANIFQQLKLSLKDYSFQINNNKQVNGHHDCILARHVILTRLAQDENMHAIAQQIKKYFLRYLEAQLSYSTDNNPLNVRIHTLEAAESLLELLGRNLSYADKPLADYVAEIRQARISGLVQVVRAQCISIATHMAEEYLEQRFSKDLEMLDVNISDALLANKALGYNNSHLQVLQKIRDLAVVQQKPLEELSLSKAEEVLVGVANDETACVKKFVVTSVAAHQTFATMQDKKICFRQKMQEMGELNLYFAKQNMGQLLQTPTGRRALFVKQYLAPSLLVKGISQANVTEASASMEVTYSKCRS